MWKSLTGPSVCQQKKKNKPREFEAKIHRKSVFKHLLQLQLVQVFTALNRMFKWISNMVTAVKILKNKTKKNVNTTKQKDFYGDYF